MPVFLKRQLAEQLFRKGKYKRLPTALRNWILTKIFPSRLNQEEQLQEEEAPTVLPILDEVEVKKTRRHYIYKPNYVIVTRLGHFFERISQLMT